MHPREQQCFIHIVRAQRRTKEAAVSSIGEKWSLKHDYKSLAAEIQLKNHHHTQLHGNSWDLLQMVSHIPIGLNEAKSSTKKSPQTNHKVLLHLRNFSENLKKCTKTTRMLQINQQASLQTTKNQDLHWSRVFVTHLSGLYGWWCHLYNWITSSSDG